jgi:hypothetical protein
MEEYIKRSDVLNYIEGLKGTPWYKDKSGNILADFMKENAVGMVRDCCVENVPAADVKEVIHGKWIHAYPVLEPHPMFMYAICSECGAEINSLSNYCYNCGAKMDLELELTEYEEKCLFCKNNYKSLNCKPKCNCMCEKHSDFELIKNIKDKF